uniref:Copine-3 n=1 Tax=Plectus sambesii TaxID=2011161 RepID=A0A914USU4_9BILA
MAASIDSPSAQHSQRSSSAKLVTRVELSIKCRDLPNMDLFSLTDPICILYIEDPIAKKWLEYGRTERIDNNLNPDFLKRFEIDYFFEEKQLMRFELYDVDSKSEKLKKEKFIGSCDISLGEIVARSPVWRELRKSPKSRSTRGEIIIAAEEIDTTKDAVLLEMCANDVDRKDRFGKSDPFLTINKVNPDDSTTVIHRTEVVRNTLDPSWAPFTIPLRSLCGSDYTRPILIECFDWNQNGAHEFIGSFYTSIDQILSTPKEQMAVFELENLALKEKKKDYRHSGMVTVTRAVLKKNYSLVDYLGAGTRLRCTIAIDLTKSNGLPFDRSSLHYLDQNGQSENDYERALIAVCTIMQDYNRDAKFAVYGFGAIPLIDGDGETVAHDFALNGDPSSAECVGVDGVLTAYRQTLLSVILHEPTCFAPIISKVAAQAHVHENGSGYEVLVILTNGALNDLKETTQTIVNASTLPLSIIIVGIGNGDFSAMEVLDGDERRLASGDVKAARDIVQFVRVDRFRREGRHSKTNHSKASLSKEVLAELPAQLISYMRANGIDPKSVTKS